VTTTGVGGRVAVVTTPDDHVVIAMTVDDVPVIERIPELGVQTGAIAMGILGNRVGVREDVARKILIEGQSTMATFPLGIRPSRLL
jgi:hypothetical protein